MRILEVAPFVAPIDDRGTHIGGAQVLLADLAAGLAARGHHVVMTAARGSHVRGVELIDLGIDSADVRPAHLGGSTARADDVAQRRAFAAVRSWLDQNADQIDVVHAHAYDAAAFQLLSGGPWPVVHTMHLPPDDPVVVDAARRATQDRFITVSQANAALWERAGRRVDAVVLNGIDLDAVPFDPIGGSHLLQAGRISPEKGIVTALAAARRLGRDLLLVGGVYDRDYYEEHVEPFVRFEPQWSVGDDVTGALFVGPRPRAEVVQIMGGAATMLMPVRWDEPFGLVALESLAAGTPVVAYARGGLPEILDEGCGVLAGPGDDAFVRAVSRAAGLARSACRARAEAFPLARMLDRYEWELSRV